ncbi:hypothetical protein [Novosphingobium sp. ZW T3_23]|uniref:hypothetical protein n=1 Tax=Novosphingobium sp. ZW T3_23 TaxID=3378084 RepID=UPI0038540581
MKRPPLYVAVHEAGHAISMLSSHPPRWEDHVSLTQLPHDALGFTKGNARFNSGMAEQLVAAGLRENLIAAAKADVIDLLAGPVAEARFRRECGATRLINAHQYAKILAQADCALPQDHDLAKVHLRLHWCDPTIVREAFIDGWKGAEAVIKRHWRHVVAVGRWLHRDGHIEDAELFPWWKERVPIALR